MPAVPRRPRALRGPVIRATRTLALTVALVVAPLSLVHTATAGVSADDIPTQEQVDAAKAAVNVAAGSVAEIEAAYAGASQRLSQVQTEAGLAAAAADAAKALLVERTAIADAAKADAVAAAAEHAKADVAVRRTAAQIYQEQGSLGGIGVYLESDGPQELADRSAALEMVTGKRQQALANASSTANVQAEAERNAGVAKTQQDAAASAASTASAHADQRARSAAEEAARIHAEQEQRIAALAAAKSTSVEVERERQDGLARKAAEEAEAKRVAEQAAIAARLESERVAAAQAAQKEAERQAAAAAAAAAAASAAASQQANTPAAPQEQPKPAPPAPPVNSGANYPQRGLTPHAQAVYNGVRNTFGITNIGGYRPTDTWGDHKDGNAVDVMIRSQAEGDAVASWVQSNAGSLSVTYVIWRQRIWFPGTSASAWRWMEDRGSITQNHDDHVHISVW